jgi:hypothetical protein
MAITREVAQAAWERFCTETEGMFEQVQLVGSLRRGRPVLHDVDVVVKTVRQEDGTIPFFVWVMGSADKEAPPETKSTQKWQPKWGIGTANPRNYVRFFLTGVQFDVYMSWSDQDFWPQVVVRTGPARRAGTYGADDQGAMQNPALAVRAKRLGLQLKMGPGGLRDREGNPVGWESEEAFFHALRLPYCPPEHRDDHRWIGMIWSRQKWPPGRVWRPCEL